MQREIFGRHTRFGGAVAVPPGGRVGSSAVLGCGEDCENQLLAVPLLVAAAVITTLNP